jgi:hypothetical protein
MNYYLIFILLISDILCEQINNEQNDLLSGVPFNLTIHEMDKLMACSTILSLKTQKDNDIILKVINKFNKSLSEKVEGKMLTEMYENCVNKIDNKTILKFFNNFTYVPDSVYLNEYDKLLLPKYDSYNENSDFDLTVEQQILSYKFEKVKELYEQKTSKERLENSQRISLGNYDITKIPFYVKGIIFILVFGIFIFGTLFYLKKLTTKPESNKKKKKKNQ